MKRFFVYTTLVIIVLLIAFSFFTLRRFIIPTTAMEGTLKAGNQVLGYIFYPQIQRDDIVMFRWPNDSVHTDVSTKALFIHRCVAMPGEQIKIDKGEVFVNGRKQSPPEKTQREYTITFNGTPFSEVFFTKQGFTKDDYVYSPATRSMRIFAQPSEMAKLKNGLKNAILNVKRVLAPSKKRNSNTFPKHSAFAWNIDNFGPLKIPGKSITITVNAKNLILYGELIKKYEGNQNVEIDVDQLRINGQTFKTYTFKQNYYFMMGDNRHNTLDSRFWGFVPADHIVGKMLMKF